MSLKSKFVLKYVLQATAKIDIHIMFGRYNRAVTYLNYFMRSGSLLKLGVCQLVDIIKTPL